MADGRPLKSKEKSKGKLTLGIRDGVDHHLNAVGLDDHLSGRLNNRVCKLRG